jgi:hypothetical protein
MGEGQVDWKKFFERYAEICPKTPVQLEIITGPPRDIPYLKDDFWGPYAEAPASGFAKYAAFARKGTEPKPYKAPKGLEAEQAWQKSQLEKSVQYCRKRLGLGLKK